MASLPDPGSVRRRVSAWRLLVAVSAGLLLAIAVAIAVAWIASARTRTTIYDVRGPLSSLRLDLDDADAEIVGGAETPVVRVERTDRYAFGRSAVATRALDGPTLRLRSRCPDTAIGSCRVSYRITVPDNVAVDVTTSAGGVRLDGLRGSARVTTSGGAVRVARFCGFVLQVRTASGAVDASTTCAPERLTVRTASGAIRAVVPPGRYRIAAASSSGTQRVRGLTGTGDAAFQIQLLSGSGDVSLDAAT